MVVWGNEEALLRPIEVLLRQCESICSGCVFGKDLRLRPRHVFENIGLCVGSASFPRLKTRVVKIKDDEGQRVLEYARERSREVVKVSFWKVEGDSDIVNIAKAKVRRQQRLSTSQRSRLRSCKNFTWAHKQRPTSSYKFHLVKLAVNDE